MKGGERSRADPGSDSQNQRQRNGDRRDPSAQIQHWSNLVMLLSALFNRFQLALAVKGEGFVG
jgi:hypothetical protein